MRRMVLAAAFVLVSTAAAAQQPPTAITRVEAWLKAVVAHEAGTLDDPAESIAAWPTPMVRRLWVDVHSLVLMMRNPRIGRFDVRQPGQRTVQQYRYTPGELRRLRALACAAGGGLHYPGCEAVDPLKELDADLRRLAQLAEEARRQGDENYILRRG